MGSASCHAIADCNAGCAISLACTVQIPTTHVPGVGDLHDAFLADQPALTSAMEGWSWLVEDRVGDAAAR